MKQLFAHYIYYHATSLIITGIFLTHIMHILHTIHYTLLLRLTPLLTGDQRSETHVRIKQIL